MSHHRWVGLLISAGLLVLALQGCQESPVTATGSHRQKTPRQHLVEVEEVSRRGVTTAHERSGSLRARRQVQIHNQEEGKISFLPYYEGDPVVEGEVLIRLEDGLLAAQLDKASANTRLARVNLNRIRDLMKKRATSEDERTRAQTALDVAVAEQRLLQTRLEYTRIRAPFSGIVTARNAEPGDVVAKHSHLLTISDPNTLMTEIHASELLLPLLKQGDPVNVRIDALGDKAFPGVIQRIHPALNPVTRQGVVEIALDPVPSGARAGQFARVTLETARIERILVSFEALRRDTEGEYVYRLEDDNRVVRIPVLGGIRVAGNIEILRGLEPGQRVVNRGFLGLSEGRKVQPVNTRNRESRLTSQSPSTQ
ncbi:MAG: efflux RND transporter periplasmic adaptor subunit [Gammaproteobacteria bacterium]|nr:efflux RND transporter periplasmic adaptor subunit [Gammaproteobacteria bacterium]